MTTLFAGGELDSIVPSDSSVYEVTTSSLFNGTYARCAIYVPNSITYAETPSWTSATTFWFRGDLSYGGGVAEKPVLSLYSGSTEVFRVTVLGNVFQMYYLSAASTFTAIGSSFSLSSPTIQTLCLKLVPATGTAEIYAAGTLRASGTATMSLFSGVTKVRLKANSGSYWSQILCKTTSTIGRVVSTKYPTGNGANTAWTSDYAAVDEVPYTDADGITSGTANQVETYTGNTPAVNGFLVEAVVVGLRAKCSETGPQNIQAAIRTSATNYFSSTQALSLGFTGAYGVWEQDPSTTATWVTAVAQAVEFGAKSIT
jgi:hypothetical protein